MHIGIYSFWTFVIGIETSVGCLGYVVYYSTPVQDIGYWNDEDHIHQIASQFGVEIYCSRKVVRIESPMTDDRHKAKDALPYSGFLSTPSRKEWHCGTGHFESVPFHPSFILGRRQNMTNVNAFEWVRTWVRKRVSRAEEFQFPIQSWRSTAPRRTRSALDGGAF